MQIQKLSKVALLYYFERQIRTGLRIIVFLSTPALQCKFYFTKWIIRAFLPVAFTIPLVEMLIFDFVAEFSTNHCREPHAAQGSDTPGALFSSPFPEGKDHHFLKDVLN